MNEKVKKQLIALIQAAQLGDQKALQTIQQIKQQADQGDELAAAIMEAMNAIAQQMQAQPTQSQKVMARLGAKLNYIRTIKGDCPEGQQVVYFKEGGRVCKKCVEKGAAGAKAESKGKDAVKEFKKKKACGGMKAKFQPGGKTSNDWTQKDDKKLLKYRLKGTKTPAEKKDSIEVQKKWNKLPEKVKAKHEVLEQKCGGKAKKHLFGGIIGF